MKILYALIFTLPLTVSAQTYPDDFDRYVNTVALSFCVALFEQYGQPGLVNHDCFGVLAADKAARKKKCKAPAPVKTYTIKYVE